MTNRRTPLDAGEVTARSQFFRASAGVVVLNAEGKALALERYDVPGAWQLPQGGLEAGEEPVDAARRELREETALSWDDVELIGEHPRWLAYELNADMRKPHTGRGQVQKWFIVRLVGRDAKIDISAVDARTGHPEFQAYDWVTLAELLRDVAAFRLPVYEPLAEYVRDLTAS